MWHRDSSWLVQRQNISTLVLIKGQRFKCQWNSGRNFDHHEFFGKYQSLIEAKKRFSINQISMPIPVHRIDSECHMSSFHHWIWLIFFFFRFRYQRTWRWTTIEILLHLHHRHHRIVFLNRRLSILSMMCEQSKTCFHLLIVRLSSIF